jgi:aryl-alcohol dehydrogenase-like predicted oxidoreductase
MWPKLNQIPAQAIMEHSLAAGMNWIDTAEMYGKGASERCVAQGLQALGKAPGEVVIATKWWPLGRTAASLRNTIGRRQEALAPYPIDLHQIHAPVALSSTRTLMETMAELLRAGHIRAAGISNYSARDMRKAHAILRELDCTLASNQVEYSLLNRRIESNGVLDTAKELGITIIAYSPLAQGLVSGKFHDDPALLRRRAALRKFSPPFGAAGLRKSQPLIDVLKEVAARHNATPSQVALNWIVSFHGDTVVAIPGATKLSQAQANAAALNFTLSPDECTAIDEASRRFR